MVKNAMRLVKTLRIGATVYHRCQQHVFLYRRQRQCKGVALSGRGMCYDHYIHVLWKTW